jgi:hypothetical protein
MHNNATFLGSMPASSDTTKSGDVVADEAELRKKVQKKK